MRFVVVGVFLVAAFAGATVEGATAPCDDAIKDQESGRYKNPESGEGLFGAWHCMTYYECDYNATTKQAKPKEKSCWILLPLKQYDPTTRTCEWFWKVNCTAANPQPSPAPTPTTTPAPVVTTTKPVITTTKPAPVITTTKPAPVITTTKPAPVTTTRKP